jgi:hypothetical protein
MYTSDPTDLTNKLLSNDTFATNTTDGPWGSDDGYQFFTTWYSNSPFFNCRVFAVFEEMNNLIMLNELFGIFEEGPYSIKGKFTWNKPWADIFLISPEVSSST